MSRIKASDWVYVAGRYLAFRRPGAGVYHLRGRAFVPQPGSDATEKVWTGCGRIVYVYPKQGNGHYRRFFDPLRLDIAKAIGARPCRACHEVLKVTS